MTNTKIPASAVSVNVDDDGVAICDILSAHGKTFGDIEYVCLSTAGTQVLKAAAAGYKVLLLGIQFSLSAAATVTIEDTDGTDLSASMPFGANGGMAVSPSIECPLTITPDAKGLQITVSASTLRGMAQILKVVI